MADQTDINNLVLQLEDLIPVLRDLGKTSTTGRAGGGTDRVVTAIGKLAVALDKNTAGKKNQAKSLDKFIKEVDEAAKKQEESNDKLEAAIKLQKERNKAHEEALELDKLSAEERKKQINRQVAEEKRKTSFEQSAASVKQNAYKKENDTWSQLIDTYGRAGSAGGLLKEKFESMGGTSLGTTFALKTMTGVAEALTSGLVDYGKAVYKGEIGAKGAAKGVVTFTKALGTTAQVLGGFLLFVPGMQIAGAALIGVGTAAKTLGAITEELAVISDRLYENYQDLARTGVTAAGGMTELTESARKLGYGIDEGELGLKKFNALIGKSSMDLALFGGTAMEGRKRFAEAFEGFARGNERLQNMGMSIDAINEGTMAYVALQSRMGLAQKKTNEQLRKGAEDYLIQMDGLTKLTGLQRKDLEDAQMKGQAIEQFRAVLDEMRESGPEGEKRAQMIMNVYSTLLKKGQTDIAQGLAESIGGVIRSKEARQFTIGIDAMTGVSEKLRQGMVNETQALALMRDGARDVTKELRPLAAAGGFGDAFSSFGQMSDLAQGLSSMDPKKAESSIAAAQNVTDAATKAATEMRTETLRSRDALQNLVLKGVNPATDALGGFARFINRVIGVTPGQGGTGAGYGGAAPGGSRLGGAASRKRAAAPAAPGAAPDISGLRLKSPEAVAGGQSDPRLINLARSIQTQLGGDLTYFSALNDTYERGPSSKHAKGLALDFAIRDPKYSAGTSDLVRNILAQSGLKGKVIDEYLNPSRSATGGHIHVELDALAKGGVTDGPSIAGESGPEAVVPLPDGKSIPVTFAGMSSTGAYNMGPLSTDTTLTKMIMSRIGSTDADVERMINRSGIGMNYNVGGVELGSKIGGGAIQGDIADQVGKLVAEGQPLQEALQKTLNDLRQALIDFASNSGDQSGLASMVGQLIELQRSQNRTSEKILQVSQN